MKQRVSAVIINENKLLLIKRIKPDKEYYVFPGGSVEEDETLQRAMWREIKEELSVDASIGKFLFKIQNGEREENFFLIDSFIGRLEIGGPEKERTNTNNQYHIEWVNLGELNQLQNLYPVEAKEKVIGIFLE